MWAGKNTHGLLNSLATGLPELGRAKWLLLNFLQQDIESKVTPKTDNVGVGVNEYSAWLYEVNVRDWDMRQYSGFLASNMMYAEKNIRWVVDPRDFFGQILPSLFTEVVLSIGMLQSKDVYEVAKSASVLTLAGQTLRTLLESLRQKCQLTHQACNLPCFPSEVLDSFVLAEKSTPEQRICELDWIWGAVHCATLCQLLDAKPSVDKQKLVFKDTGIEIDFSSIATKYCERVGLGLKPRLVHIDAFHKASCQKHRHIYMGEPGTITSVDRSIAKTRLANWIDSAAQGQYIESCVPRFDFATDIAKTASKQIYSWSLLDGDPQSKLSLISDAGLNEVERRIRDMLKILDPSVKKLILSWAFDLFALTSGGNHNVKAIFCGIPNKYYIKYRGSYDIGIYDNRLEVTSQARETRADNPGLERDITWRLYGDRSPLVNVYFPENDLGLLSFADFKVACLDTLS